MSDLKSKHEKLCIVARNYSVDPKHAKDYTSVTIVDNMRPDRVMIESQNRLEKAEQKREVAEIKCDKAKA